MEDLLSNEKRSSAKIGFLRIYIEIDLFTLHRFWTKFVYWQYLLMEVEQFSKFT